MRADSTNNTTSLLHHFSQDELAVLRYNLILAYLATRYTHNKITFTPNRSTSHSLYKKKNKELGEMRKVCMIMRNATQDYSEKIKLLHDFPVAAEVGNCNEHANVAYYYIQEAIRPEDMVSFARIDMVEDHVFIVIGVDPKKQFTDPECWPKTAVICDPWAETIYPAVLYKNLIKEILARAEHPFNGNTELMQYKNYYTATNAFTTPNEIPKFKDLSPADLRKIGTALIIHQNLTSSERHKQSLVAQYRQCIWDECKQKSKSIAQLYLPAILQQYIFSPLSVENKDHLLKKKADLLSALVEHEEFTHIIPTPCAPSHMTEEDKIKYLPELWVQGKKWFENSDEQPLNELDNKLKKQEMIALKLKRECDVGLFLMTAGPAMMLSRFCYSCSVTIKRRSTTHAQASKAETQRPLLSTSGRYPKYFSDLKWDWTQVSFFDRTTTAPATNLHANFFTNSMRQRNIGIFNYTPINLMKKNFTTLRKR